MKKPGFWGWEINAIASRKMTYSEDDLNNEPTDSVAEIRGVISFDYNGRTVFVQADVETVASSLSEERGAIRWEQNVIDREVELTEQCFFIFRLQGHTWTSIIGRDKLVAEFFRSWEAQKLDRDAWKQWIEELRSIELNEEDARFLSLGLKTRAIFYAVSDTADRLRYGLYENGELLEQLDTDVGYEITNWQSSIHNITADEIGDVEEWVDRFFKDQDALELSVNFTNWVGYIMHKAGDKFISTDPNGNFERIDFVAW